MSEENKERGEETRSGPGKRVSRRTLLASLGMAGAAAVLGVSVAAVNGSGAEMWEAKGTRVTTMDELRAMTGEADPALVYYVTDPGREGHFYCDVDDPVSRDNDGTILVTVSGVRYKRIRETEYTNVKWFGAKGDGSHDDFTAIQAAIDAVSLQGGGTVFFPKGTYSVSPYLSKWIKLKDNVNLLGEGTSSVIKVKDDAGDYFAIFYGSTSEPLRNVRISNLKFDQNPQNNLSCHIDLDRKDTRYFFQFCIISYRYENIAIDNVEFDPTCGVNSISLNSDTGKLASITNCYFNFVIAKGNGTYDNSAIYLNGRNHLVANCLFHAGPGQKARGAIETHLGQSTIANNVMDGYYTGVNLQAGNVSGSDDRCDMTITGIQLGSFQKAGVVSNALITGNVIVNAGHYPTKVESYRAGIALRSTVIGARISGNLISDTYDEPKGFCSIRISDGEGTYTDVEVTGNQIRTNQGGLWLLLSPSVRTDVRSLVFTSPVYPPAAGTYRPGDIVWITGLNSKDGITPVGCKAVSEGTSGTLSGIRAAGEAGQPVITVSDASPLETGQWIRITSGNQVRKIVRIAGSEVRLETPLATAIQGTSPVTYAAPLWKPFGRLGSLAPVDDTNGATLSEIEGEVNRLKEVLRTYGIVGR
ncbi:glycosyl hydrolase family 28-related protein [Paenibacillus oceani]|uniref:Rhamnogalacturonase A/B/Epimerase-like pectate lyase domain-containing protein n=1 Tax=Paenibacillus oceani TaxID=2772510 RepID=A0A927C7L0_9BACL|nr:glycosyl hydrolase family 28-related protein [Paenibacillus oceani]MBD2862859.1 hypothetical protein [Paenibacillus oceani]